MSKKQNQKDLSGFIFDVQSNTVMAQGGTFENMKEKISAVRAIVPNRSNNEIILVLQHFDNCVDRTVQAFMEGSATAVLKEWTVTGKKKNKKKKTKSKPPAESSVNLPDSSKPAITEEEQSAVSSEKGGINGYHVNGSANDTESVDSLSEGLETLSIDARELEESEPATPDTPDGAALLQFENGITNLSPKSASTRSSQNTQSLRVQPELRNAGKPLSRSASSTQSPAPSSLTMLDEVPVPPGNKKLGSNIEKSVKDLQRCTVSLSRYRVVVKEEMDASIKKMKQVFAELQSCLMDREVALLGEMDKVKAEASGHLEHFADQWDQITSDAWVRSTVRYGLPLEFLSLPPMFFRIFPPSQDPVCRCLMSLAIQHLLDILVVETVPGAEHRMGLLQPVCCPEELGGMEGDPGLQMTQSLPGLQVIQNVFPQVNPPRGQAGQLSGISELNGVLPPHSNSALPSQVSQIFPQLVSLPVSCPSIQPSLSPSHFHEGPGGIGSSPQVHPGETPMLPRRHAHSGPITDADGP
ncbi:spermatogenesis-associated serine-rich protein 2 isoform X3 [Thamnophis elegans]|uniref:spermatogenesis-associated serine-rich protein 2 isoform X3 n=1 Tax=Thamnophis elegans TaxID=35005 RepID=UPI0013780025|nr:spermatogenesis-associated serine-rich protein 2 isoform X3 [Thamnophis elegans]